MEEEFLPPTQLQEDDPPARRTPVPSSTVVPTPREYNKVVLFCWRKDDGTPFKVFMKDLFDNSEIPPQFYKYQMKAKSRMKRLRGLKSFAPLSMSMFGKVQEGINFFIKKIFIYKHVYNT